MDIFLKSVDLVLMIIFTVMIFAIAFFGCIPSTSIMYVIICFIGTRVIAISNITTVKEKK